jgi:hypothetical protein
MATVLIVGSLLAVLIIATVLDNKRPRRAPQATLLLV